MTSFIECYFGHSSRISFAVCTPHHRLALLGALCAHSPVPALLPFVSASHFGRKKKCRLQSKVTVEFKAKTRVPCTTFSLYQNICTSAREPVLFSFLFSLQHFSNHPRLKETSPEEEVVRTVCIILSGISS